MSTKFYTLPKGTEPTGEVINTLITSDQRKKDVEHYETLKKYYDNEVITSRKSPNDLLTITNYARYITQTNVGHLLGNPVSYSATKGYDIDSVTDQYRKQTISNLDSALATDASIFGHAFERIYVDDEKNSESTKIDPRNIILVHDNTVKHDKMFAVIYAASIGADGKAVDSQYDVTILTQTMIFERTLKGNKLTLTDVLDMSHVYGEVPVIEYANDNDKMGDFEPVIPLIDAYNILQSDRVIDREKLVDAILAVYGARFDEEGRQNLKDGRLVELPDGAKMEYIIKNINEADADVLRQTLSADIHKISMTPDMSDENFAGNSSGVALMFKLLPFENHTKDKERYFETGLMSRFAIYNHFLNVTSNVQIIPIEDVDAVFKRSLPRNDLETSNMINNLIGLVDKETLVDQLSFVRDPKETVEQAESESNGKDDDFGANEITDQNKTTTPLITTSPDEGNDNNEDNGVTE